jgi:hypothetical protein
MQCACGSGVFPRRRPPKPDTVCSIEDKLFAEGNATATAVYARRDDELALTARQLCKSIKVPRLGLLHA